MAREEKNVFRDAKFGDKFLTRNGQVMIYQKQAREDVYCLFDEEGDCVIEYRPNGGVIYEYTGDAEPQEDDIVKKYDRPSLPSDFDEAAREYAKTTSVKVWGRIDPKKDLKGYMARANYETGLLEGFKAGAEWLAIQGYTTEETVDRTPLNGPAGICLNLHDSTGFKIGDKVIVQIRKID